MSASDSFGDFTGIPGLGRGTFIVDEIIENSNGFATGPERGLLSAVLFDGIMSYISYASASSKAGKLAFREAHYWVHTRDSEYVFSFDNVCEALGIDPDALRFGLANVCNGDESAWKRLRRNS